MDIDSQLNEIDKCFYEYRDYLYNNILEEIKAILEEKIICKRVAIVCGGTHTEHLKKDFLSILKDCEIIDEQSEDIKNSKKFPLCNIYDYDHINEFDVLIISSYDYREDVKIKLREKKYLGCIVDIYDELIKRNITISTEYYHLNKDPYSLLIIGRHLLKVKKYDQNKKQIFLAIIALFIKNKDILQAKKYLKLYLQNDHTHNKKYERVLEKLLELEKNIFNLLHMRNKRDIICFWQDDLRFTISLNMPYLNKCREEGIDFKKVYGTSISTRSTYGCMLERSDETDLFMYERGKNQIAELLEIYGYKAFHVGNKGECIELKKFDYQGVAHLGDYETPTTLLYWEALKILLTEKDPVFIMIHTLLETHPPFYAPTLENYSFEYQSELFRIISSENFEIFDNNAINAAQYLDEENEYMSFLLSNRTVKIFMSDHGCSVSKNSRQYSEEASHVPFVIVGDKIPHIEEYRLVSLKNFYEIINYIITLNGYEKIYSDFILINGVDLYNENFINCAIDVGMAEFGVQYTGLRTTQDMYVYSATGEEYYYLLPNEFDNLITNKKYSKRIESLKSLTKKEMIDISRHEKFKLSHRLYNAIGRKVQLFSN